MSDNTPVDPNILAIFEQMQPYLEMLRGLVATFVAEGFTDAEAHTLAVTVVTAPQQSAGGAS